MIPIITLVILVAAAAKKTDIFPEFAAGAEEGLRTSAELIPSLVFLLTAVGMFRASGAIELLSELLAPLTELIGFPGECVPLALIRPVSGSGAAAVFESVLRENSPDSFAGRTASVLLGSSETTFYVLTVYYGAVGIKNGRRAVFPAIAGDIAGILLSVLTVRIFLGNK